MKGRYCGMCDEWVKGKECPACGADTYPAEKEKPKPVDLMDALRRALPKPVPPTHEGRADALRMEMCRLASWSGTPDAVADALMAAVEADNRRLAAMPDGKSDVVQRLLVGLKDLVEDVRWFAQDMADREPPHQLDSFGRAEAAIAYAEEPKA